MEIGEGGGGEFRRVNVVYFLSRGGNVEHPHLIRVRHLHRAGVRLRDVKRWLSELRGKDMPDSFAWSYKRRYRSGYVWQDLTDDDLITPISDNEFVLKGSELPHRPLHPSSTINDLQPRPFPPLISEKSSRATGAAAEEEKEKEKEKEAAEAAAEATTTTAAERPKPKSSPTETLRIVLEEEDDEVLSPNLPPPPPRDSSDESAAQRRRSAVFKIDACQAAEQARGRDKKDQQQGQQEEEEEEEGELQEREDSYRMAGESQSQSQSQSQSRSLRRASHVLRNILTCRVVEISDAALRPVSRPERSSGDGGGSQLAARRRTNLEGRHYDSRLVINSLNR